MSRDYEVDCSIAMSCSPPSLLLLDGTDMYDCFVSDVLRYGVCCERR